MCNGHKLCVCFENGLCQIFRGTKKLPLDRVALTIKDNRSDTLFVGDVTDFPGLT
jgi:hypothetical protein